MRQGSKSTFDTFKKVLSLMLTQVVWNWFELTVKGIQEMTSLKEKSLRDFTLWGRLKENSIHTSIT